MASPNPHPTLLDQNQILQRSFDEQNDRLRVETEVATVTITGGSQEILITDDIDAIKLGDGNHNYASVNTDGSLNIRKINNLITVPWDSFLGSFPNTTTEVYTYKSSGVTVSTVTVVYTDTTKQTISSLART